eukprot:COSAG02_NODE_1691_length_11296_cov_7.891757_17_plen_95_part_00
MCCPFNEVAGGENLNDYHLKYLTSAPFVASGRRLWTRGAGSISSSEPLNVHFSIGIGHSHVKERNFLPVCRPRRRARARPYASVRRPGYVRDDG